MAKKQQIDLSALAQMIQQGQLGVANPPAQGGAFSFMEDRVKPVKANEYDIFTSLPSLTTYKGVQGTKQKLNDEARAMVPDSSTFAKAVMDRDLYSGIESQALQALQLYGDTYLQNYAKDPYFAFSKEGRDLVKGMQQIVTDPNLVKYEELKVNEDKAMETAADKDLMDMPLVAGNGKVAVIRNGRTMWVNPATLKTDDRVLTVRDRHTLVEQGAVNDVTLIDMSSSEDAFSKITDAAADLGTNKVEDLFGNTESDQILQKQKRMDWLRDIGLTQQDWNTFTSEYVKRYGIPKSPEAIKTWVMNRADDYMAGGMDYSYTREKGVNDSSDTNPDGTPKYTGKEGPLQVLLKGVQNAETVISAENDDEVLKKKFKEENSPEKSTAPQYLKDYWEDPEAKVQADIVQPVPGQLWTSSKSYKGTDANNVNAGEMPLSANPVYKAIAIENQPLTTVDGVELEPTTTIPNTDEPLFVVFENEDGKEVPYVYMSVYTSKDEWDWDSNVPDELVDSDFFGKKVGGMYQQGMIGELESYDEITDPGTQHYHKVMNIHLNDDKNAWLRTTKLAENVYEATVKVRLDPGADRLLRILDNNNFYSPKPHNASPTARQQTSDVILE